MGLEGIPKIDPGRAPCSRPRSTRRPGPSQRKRNRQGLIPAVKHTSGEAFSQRFALFVIASGEQHSVRDFVSAAAAELGMTLQWRGRGVDEKGYDDLDRCIVAVDPHYYRPTEVDALLGDASKARTRLGWRPRVGFRDLVAEMVREDMKLAERDNLVKKHGYSAYDFHE